MKVTQFEVGFGCITEADLSLRLCPVCHCKAGAVWSLTSSVSLRGREGVSTMVERDGVSTMVAEIQRSVMWYGRREYSIKFRTFLLNETYHWAVRR